MMGPRQVAQGALFYEFSLERHVPEDHLLRSIDRFVDLGDVRARLAPLYSSTGRPSIDPELMIRMLLVGYCFGIRSERRLCEEVHLNLAYRWFCRLDLADRVPDHSTFSKNRHGRFRDCDLLAPRLRDDGAPVHRGRARRRRAVRRRCQPDRGGREQAALDRPRGLGPGGDRSRHGAARGPGVSRGSRRRGLRRGEPGRAEVHLARRSRGAVDRRSEGSRLLRLCDQLPGRHRQRDHRRRRDDARHPPGGGRCRAHHDRPHDRPLRPLPRAADRRQRLRLRADAGLARRGARDRAAHPCLRQVGPQRRDASSAPTSPTTATPTPTSARPARRSGSSTGRPTPTGRRAAASMRKA